MATFFRIGERLVNIEHVESTFLLNDKDNKPAIQLRMASGATLSVPYADRAAIEDLLMKSRPPEAGSR